MSASLASVSLQEQQQFAGEHVLKIYKNDQNFKYLVVHKVFDLTGCLLFQQDRVQLVSLIQ
jgi:hypothetical protein